MSGSATPDYTADFEPARRAELEWITERRAAVGLPPVNDDLVGLAFSGGGIRSATLNLGVLQALEAGGVLRQVDVLSSVSGGGYVASCYHWLRAHARVAGEHSVFARKVAGGNASVLDWLRSHGKYLIAQRGFSLWTLIASVLAAIFVNVMVLGPPLLIAVYGLTLGWLPLAWPQWLALPGSSIHEHHGFLLLLMSGAFCLLLFPLAAVAFAVLAGADGLASRAHIDRWRIGMGRLLVAGFALIGLGLIPVLARLGGLVEHMFSFEAARALGKHLSYLMPVLGGVASLMMDKRKGGTGRGRWAMVGVTLLAYGVLVLCYHLAVGHAWLHSTGFAALLGLSLLLALVCNINRVSIHAYYRARLGVAFLPRLEGDSTTDPGGFRLDRIGPKLGAPLPLINATLNTTSSANTTLASRQGASFFFSPLYSGSTPTGIRNGESFADGHLALSNAFSISGAAVDPDMVDTRARAVSFLMALFNLRLGYWSANPKFADRRSRFLPWWWIFIGREMFGYGLDETRRHIHLSDGGGFENLGIYELIRRRVRYLIVTDAGADPQTALADLGRAIERVRVDFAAEIDIDADRLYRQRDDALMQQPYALGRIRYADGSQGEILYIKPRLCAGLSADIYAYWRSNPAFPEQPTSEQFFGEAQFEAYRALGQQIVEQLLDSASPDSMAQWFARIRQRPQASAAP